jgi:hypothetical protein
MSHTPGPWFVDAEGAKDAGTKGGFIPFDACGCCNSPWMCGETEKEQAANARLIAAAPELLEALEPFAKFACGCGECHNCRALAAVNKARGE